MSISADILPPAAVTQALIKGTNEYLLNSSDWHLIHLLVFFTGVSVFLLQ